MNRSFSLILLAVLLVAGMAGCSTPTPPPPTAVPSATPIPPTATPSVPEVVQKMHWFGVSAYLYRGSQIMYFDPVALDGDLPQADLILVTHADLDHWDVNNLLKIIGPDTKLIISPNIIGVYETAKEQLGIEAIVLKEGESTEVNGVAVQAVPAYNMRYHQRKYGGVGFIVTLDGTSIYHAGGTAPYPEMAQYECDLAILPVYRNEELREMIALVPAKYYMVMHIAFSAAAAYEAVLNQEFGPDKLFFTPAFGPYQP